MIANGLMNPTEGNVRICDVSLSKKKMFSKLTGLFTDKLVLYPVLTVKDTILYFMGIYNIPASCYSMYSQMFRIYEFEKRKIEELSTGMLKKVMLLISMLNQPKVLFLDEPFSGLDIDSKEELSNIIKQLSEEKRMKIIISSHDLYETQEVIIMEAGRVLESGNYRELIEKYHKNKLIKVTCTKSDAIISRFSQNIEKVYGDTIILGLLKEDMHELIRMVDYTMIKNIVNNEMSLEQLYGEVRKHAI